MLQDSRSDDGRGKLSWDDLFKLVSPVLFWVACAELFVAATRWFLVEMFHPVFLKNPQNDTALWWLGAAVLCFVLSWLLSEPDESSRYDD